MRDLAPRLERLFREGRPFALVTVADAGGSSPSTIGQSMAVDADGRVHGSLSAGCAESDAYTRAAEVLKRGVLQCVRVEMNGSDPLGEGLSCGGSLLLLIRLVRPGVERALPTALAALAGGEPFTLVTALEGPHAGAQAVLRGNVAVGELPLDEADRAAATHPRGATSGSGPSTSGTSTSGNGSGTCEAIRLTDGSRALIQRFDPPPELFLFGVNAYTDPLRAQGEALGYHVTVCDARPTFAASLPGAAVEWPHRHLASAALDERSAICSLTHDLRFEVPLLRAALRGPAGYVGALGSRQANEQRLRELRRAGCTEAELARLRAPMGLDLGDPSPAATALAVAAELVQARTGRSGRPLSLIGGPIHDRDTGDGRQDDVGSAYGCSGARL